MTGLEALNELIDEGTNDIYVGPSNCTCNNCKTCWYRIIRMAIEEKEPNDNTHQMQTALMIQSLDMQEFLGLYTKGILATFQQFIQDSLDCVTKEDKKRLIQLSIGKLEINAVENKDKVPKNLTTPPFNGSNLIEG